MYVNTEVAVLTPVCVPPCNELLAVKDAVDVIVNMEETVNVIDGMGLCDKIALDDPVFVEATEKEDIRAGDAVVFAVPVAFEFCVVVNLAKEVDVLLSDKVNILEME